MSNRQKFAEYKPVEIGKGDGATTVLPTSRANALSISSFKEGKIADGNDATNVIATANTMRLAFYYREKRDAELLAEQTLAKPSANGKDFVAMFAKLSANECKN